jgi:hypothetical protein
MALVSPGVQVTVTDQSNYAPTAIGSVAYILLATAQNKVAPGGTAYAAGTLAENAGKVYTITSQRDLVTTFGNPVFKTTAGGAAINGDEQNEYGLMAAYSALGVSNQIYVQRADVDLDALTGTTARPTKNPSNGNLWLDTASSNYGVFEWSTATQDFSQRIPAVISEISNLAGDSFTPNINIGAIGDYAVNALNPYNPVFYKIYNNTWQLVGNIGWQSGIPSVTGNAVNPVIGATSIIAINGTNITLGIGSNVNTVAAAINSVFSIDNGGLLARVSNNQLVISATANATASSANIVNVTGTALTTLGISPGIYPAAAVQITPYFQIPSWQGNAFVGKPSGSVWQKASAVGNGENMVVSEFSNASQTWNSLTVNSYANVFAATYGLDPTGGGLNVNQGVVFNQFNPYENNTLSNYLWRRKVKGATVLTGSSTSPSVPGVGSSFTLATRPSSSSASITTYTVSISTASVAGFIQAVAAANIPNVTATQISSGAMTITHRNGGDMLLIDGVGTPLANVGFNSSSTNVYATPALGDTALIGTNWQPLENYTYTAKATQPTVAPDSGKLWYYSTPSRVDIMISNGSAWVGYKTLSTDIRGYNLTQTNDNGPILATSAPLIQDNGSSLVYGDLWLDTSDLENYPKLYRWQNVSGIDQWVLIDNADLVSQNGILFADARWATNGTTDPVTDAIPSIQSLLTSNYVDLDAPDPALYPRGMLLFNTRASGYNVKEYRTQYFTSAAYPNQSLPTAKSTWISVSGTDTDGSPNFGRRSVRGVVVAALKSSIDSSTSLREDQNQFNLISCPGYPELIPNMVALNEDRDNTAFVIGDTPLRLPATGTDIQAWANNSQGATSTGERGLVTISPYVGIYYPQGQTNDLDGNAIIVPASHAVIRAIIKSDNISYPWLAPAGTRRGLIDNLDAIGYISSNGTFVSIGVTQGLRDVMYTNKINPLTFLPGNGLLIYGQKTLSADLSSLDRVNVARLVNYLRQQLNVIARPFVFEPNDPITRNAILAVVNGLLNDLVAKRGITDYLTVCDSTNNTPERIARNELYVDVAIQPTKSVEFIYIPIRLKNPGEIQAGNLASSSATGTGA